MGTVHARSIIDGLIPHTTLAAVADPNEAAFRNFSETSRFADGSTLIHSGEVDAVLIATPHYEHTTIGIEALKAGLHLLVEKPISVHKADCERLIAAHTNSSQVFAAMFNQRTDPSYIKLRNLIQTGQIGPIRRINWIITDWFRTQAYYSSGGWRATWAGEGGGVLLNQCPHQLDLWQWIFGMPTKVRAFGRVGRYHDIEVEDDVTAYFEYENGATGIFVTSTGEAPGTNRLEVVGDLGRVVVENGQIEFTRNEVSMKDFCETTPERFSKPPIWNVRIPVAGGTGLQHVGILQNFAGAILDGLPLISPAKEGIHSVELANAMLLSIFEDRTIQLPLDGTEYEVFLKKKIADSRFIKKERVTLALDDDFAKSFSR